ncbi:hypothetical protein POF50_010935 [Streptomyces sp. SL13]|uniref:Uncharacterized protein n=1 Tax=Streptantibioticus silvisoli TaxID=2705255 RepID=A0AA90H334_9ACTN|nr:hypothetical protein [Streptantibioticus silvisoli]MDI5967225.1 hypothetical protein [Streptantibioticus silvisoli]MDI5969844.1 hypothetical protein [Streptantibioticus silvisoli]
MNGRLLPLAAGAVMAASLVLTGCGSQTVTQKPGAAPASINPTTPAPKGGGSGAMIKLQPVGRSVRVAADGKQLQVSTDTGGCKKAKLVAHESSASVTLSLEVTDHHSAGQMCPQFVKVTKVTVELKAPLGSRSVFDADGGKKVAAVKS